MIEVCIFLILLLCALVLFVIEIMLGINWLYKKRKHKDTGKLNRRLKKISILCIISVVLTGGVMMFTHVAVYTPAIKDEHGNTMEHSIATLERIQVNGRKEWISIRGQNKDNPVLLFLAGGPGGTQMAAVRHDLAELEKKFVVVVWDQPGSGKSYVEKDEDQDVDTYIEDGIAVSEYLCTKFTQEKIYLLGESWGSALGVFLASERPDLYHAVVGTGQMIDFLETEKVDYEKAIEIAQKQGDEDLIQKLEKNGPPPYYGSDVTWKSADYLNYLSSYMSKNPEIKGGYHTFRDLLSPEYSILDKINYFRGIVTTFNDVYPQLYSIDLRTDYTELEVPIYFFLGRHDLNAPTAFVEEYMEILKAPHKEIIWFEHSGHSPWSSESEKFVDNMIAVMNQTHTNE